MNIPSEVTVCIDAREKLPILYPNWIDFYPDRTDYHRMVRVHTETVTMPAGDVCLKGADRISIVECKRGVRELHNNLETDDYPRFIRATTRLADSTERPYFLIEANITDLYVPSKHVRCPEQVFDHLCQIISRFGLRLIWTPPLKAERSRRRLGEFLVRLLLTHQFHPQRERKPWDGKTREFMWDVAPTWEVYTGAHTDE